MTDDTVWRPVVGMEGRYEVSSRGDVRSVRTRKIRALTVSDKGYYTLKLPRLTPGRTWKTYKVHILVLEAFTGPRPDGLIARHLNDVKLDNRAENLVWGTYSENHYDAVRNGIRKPLAPAVIRWDSLEPMTAPQPVSSTHRNARETHCPKGHPYSGLNLLVDKRGHRYCRICIAAKQNRMKEARLLARQSVEAS